MNHTFMRWLMETLADFADWLEKVLAGPKPGHPRDKPNTDAGPPPTPPR